MTNFKHQLHQIRAFAFDVDGVFTDGQVYLNEGKEFIRSVNIKDGYAVQYCVKMGYPIAIISGGSSEAIVLRFKKLGVTDIYMSSSNKLDDYEDFRIKYGLEHEDILYMGDDIPDYEIMQRVGLPCCPVDAAHEIKELSSYISPRGGGEGCVRDVIEQVLKVQDKWMADGSIQW